MTNQPTTWTVDDREKGVQYWEYVEEVLVPRWLSESANEIVGELFGTTAENVTRLLTISEFAGNIYWSLNRGHELRRLDSVLEELTGFLGLTNDPKTTRDASYLLSEIANNLGADEDIVDWLREA